jgi:microcystin-dependent protein
MFNSKKLLLSLSALVVLGVGLFIFTSAGTLEKSNQEAISDLFAELSVIEDNVETLEMYDPNRSESTLGEITMFAGNFAPRGWQFCDGQILPISQHQALFSLLGTTYGGDGRTTFGLPDLDGRVPLHVGGHRDHTLGEKGKMQGERNAAAGEDSKSIRYLGLNFIIATQGLFPSRN